MPLPSPEFFEKWENWAEALIEFLDSTSQPEQLEVIQLVDASVGNLPSPRQRGLVIHILDETGGEVPAFSDGSDWRRMTDRSIVS